VNVIIETTQHRRINKTPQSGWSLKSFARIAENIRSIKKQNKKFNGGSLI